MSLFALGRPAAVGGKCRPIMLLSGALPLYASTVKLPRRTDYLISAHAYAETPPVLRHLPLPNTCPLPRKQLSPKLLPRLCYRIYGGQMPTMVIFRGHASGEGANAQHTLRINAVMILLV